MAIAGVTAALLAPVGRVGSCPSGGDCVVLVTNILFVPVTRWLWAPVSVVAGLVTWSVVHRRAVHRARVESGARR
ncbi:hypothetical protein [Cellulomonas sp.]|uniref:hypothetical protein n=1 Tax=Cellulomonas sp. TaxID=40001 RepID=UPI001B07E926|nr:hypothetical protein [Cellulomonas sp.]MBO9556401.1 hypothetical protein [Cellulomonas sp.]